MTLQEFVKSPTGARVVLFGIGRANLAVLRRLLFFGCRPVVLTEGEPHADTCAYLLKNGVPFTVGAFPDRVEADVLVRSPGLRPDLPPFLAHRQNGGLVTEESSITRALLPCHLIGVTGSDGKTTTAALCALLLKASGVCAWLGGNNGVPLLDRVGEMGENDVAVMELSSFQLIDAPRAADTAVITNVTPNHLNWHTDMAEYLAAKCRIFGTGTRLITNAACDLTRALGLAHAGRGEKALFFGESLTDIPPSADKIFTEGEDVCLLADGCRVRYTCLGDFRLPGRHNRENLLAALGATAPWLTPVAPSVAIRDFYGVPHRLQYVATVGGVHYFNSSIDTSPTRTRAALEALGGQPIVIAGGRGKGVSLAPLATALRAHARAVCLYGEAAGEIAAGLGDLPHSIHLRFADAFTAAAAKAVAGDTVLLSPGCTAFGEFRDFEERGACFHRLVAALARERK